MSATRDGADAAAGRAAAATLYYEVGSAMPPADADAQLGGVLDALRQNSRAVARISGFHDAAGDAATNEALARERAEGVQHWLEAQGVPAERIVLDKPMATTGDGPAQEARRVEVTVE
ncbi:MULTISPECIES: OmpA family protein [unclassified Lysobacter]|uniref:OmpA family protein n=1 Tax=unclassified Lysobacter TaxID=2635362 RepID=UPI002412392E|nr:MULTISPECIES: OmpA family protein [unclassified Lysobacter]